MTKKHYVAIARCIKDSTIINRRDITYIDKDLLINDLSDMFKRDNVLFNYTRFNNACNGV